MQNPVIAAAASAVILAAGAAPSRAADLVVYSTVAAKAALARIVPAYEQSSGNKVTLRMATTGELQAAIAGGAPVDVAVLTRQALDDLAGKGRLDGASLVTVAKSRLGVAVKKGAAQPAIGTADGFRRSLLAAKSIAYTAQGATGKQLHDIFARMEIGDAMHAKTVLVHKGTAPEAVVRGEAELALTQISEILMEPAAQLVGPLPEGVQVPTVFAAGLGSHGKAQDAARSFVEALTSPAAKAILKSSGLEPE